MAEDEFELERWITDWEVSSRYPVYTRANAGEVLPDPSSPLNATLVWNKGLNLGWREGYVRTLGTHRDGRARRDDARDDRQLRRLPLRELLGHRADRRAPARA